MLDCLTGKCNLTEFNRYTISKCAAVSKKNDEIIDWLLNEYIGDYENVKAAFKDAGQEHIVNFIIANGGISNFNSHFESIRN